MMQGQDSPSRAPRRRSTQRPNPASNGRRLKHNVRVGGRRTTIVLEAYVWDSIDSMLDREGVSLDTFCADVDDTRLHSSMASSARLVVLAYFRLLEQINSPPFVDPELQRLGREGRFARRRQPGRPYRSCSWRSGALRKTKRVLNSLTGVGDAATRCCDAVMAVGPQ